jgi:hypothetical protein
MTQTYTFTQDDFTSATNINIDEIQAQIMAAAYTSAIFQYTDFTYNSSIDFTLVIAFDDTLSGPDETALATLVDTYTYHTLADKIAIVSDVKTSGTNAGTFTSGSWTTRVLNTIIGDQNFAAVSSNQIILQPGSYSITARAPACNVLGHQIRLRNITDSTDAAMGTSTFANGGIVNFSEISATFSINTEKIYEIQHMCALTYLHIGLGRSTGFNSDEIYTLVTIKKLD